MKYEFTGVNRIPYISLLALWSISLVVNLPGLPIYALFRELHNIFPTASETHLLLVKLLPNLIIIPFVLISGRLSVNKDKALLVLIGLIVFLMSGIAYYFVDTVIGIIVLSCFIYMGAGIVVPLSAGMVAQYFEGKYRMKELGVKSSVGNMILIISTFAINELMDINWRLSFLIYLMPVIPIIMSHFFTKKYIEGNELVSKVSVITAHKVAHKKNPALYPEIVQGAWKRKLTGLMFLFFALTYTTVILTFYLPNKMFIEGMDDSIIALVITLFFASVSIPGLFITRIVNVLKDKTIRLSLYIMLIGILMTILFFNSVTIILSAMLIGGSFGILQPLVYDKATHISEEDRVMTEHLSFVLSMKYVSVLLAPIVMKLFEAMTGKENETLPFIISLIFLITLSLMCIISPDAFIFKVDKSYYSHKTKKH